MLILHRFVSLVLFALYSNDYCLSTVFMLTKCGRQAKDCYFVYTIFLHQRWSKCTLETPVTWVPNPILLKVVSLSTLPMSPKDEFRLMALPPGIKPFFATGQSSCLTF